MKNTVDHVFRELQVRCVVMDVGASGDVPARWRALGRNVTWVGVGPESMQQERSTDIFEAVHFVPGVISPGTGTDTGLYVTQTPSFSSLLHPRPGAIENFLDPQLTVNRCAPVRTVTVDSIVRDLALPGVDVLHTNICGVDVPVFTGLSADLKDGILVLETCLDLVDVYQEQDSDISRYPELIADGFWLSSAHVSGPIRMSRAASTRLASLDASLDMDFLTQHHRRTPGWIYSRFFRTREWLASKGAQRRDYVILWACAVVDGQFGYAAELLLDYESRFGTDRSHALMWADTARRLKALRRRRFLRDMRLRIGLRVRQTFGPW